MPELAISFEGEARSGWEERQVLFTNWCCKILLNLIPFLQLEVITKMPLPQKNIYRNRRVDGKGL